MIHSMGMPMGLTLRVLSSLLLFLLVAPATAQQIRFSEDFSRLRTSIEVAPTIDAAAPGYNLIALRVEFQPDTTRFTTGDGTFDGPLFDASLSPTIDPLPHNAAYFEAHLQFLRNYVARVSDGQTQIASYLIPEVVRLSQSMPAYSPTGFEADSDAERSKLAAMINEAWSQADALSDFNEVLPYEETAFVIFHAGVGRDIELVGTVLDKTPQDIPSIFFPRIQLLNLGGEIVSFKGLPVNNTIILPRTETRQGFDFIQDQPFLAEFSINGLLAASFFNFAGVPDLFNTFDGQSAIGPFGLMDPLGIFAFNGLFPPEPSPWTKVKLGWQTPIHINGSVGQDVSVEAAAAASGPAIYRIPITQDEYFLVENRQRDLEGDGLVMSIWRDGAFSEQRIQNGDENFNSIFVDGFNGGVVVDVDNFDWALPGGLDSDGNDLNGGMLVWHIDESSFREQLVTNTVNADPERRGVDLEEADGVQDIGFPPSNPFAPQTHLGTPFDFFYEGNPITAITRSAGEVRLYENRFGPNTYPNSNNNSNGPSLIELSGFSAPGSSMTFRYEPAIHPFLSDVQLFPSSSLPTLDTPVHDFKLLPDASVIAYAGRNGITISASGTSQAIDAGNGPAIGPVLLDGSQSVFLSFDGVLIYWTRFDGSTKVEEIALPIPSGPDTHFGQANHPFEESDFFYVSETDRYYFFEYELPLRRQEGGILWEINPAAPEPEGRAIALDLGSESVHSVAYAGDGRIAAITRNGAHFLDGSAAWTFSLPEPPYGLASFGQDTTGTVGVFKDPASGRLFWLLEDETEPVIVDPSPSVVTLEGQAGLHTSVATFGTRLPLLADLDGDRRLDVLVEHQGQFYGYTQNGGLVDGFPIGEIEPSFLNGQPLLIRMADIGLVILRADDSSLTAYELFSGRKIDGFPLAFDALSAPPLITGGRLYLALQGGEITSYAMAGIEEVIWGQWRGDDHNLNYVQLASPASSMESAAFLLEPDDTYNWPNPIREGVTHFRINPTEDVSVHIRIIDLAGNMMDEWDAGRIRAGSPADIRWNTQISSGIYFARVTATDDTGRSETALIRFAVIR